MAKVAKNWSTCALWARMEKPHSNSDTWKPVFTEASFTVPKIQSFGGKKN